MKPFEPFPYQIHDLRVLKENNYIGLLAIEPGGAKTAEALMAHRDSGSKVTLVIAPQSTHDSAWKDDAEWILGETPRVIGRSKKSERDALEDFKLGYPAIYLASPQFLTRAKDITEWMGDLCIVDEGHQLGRPGGVGQKQLQKLTETFPMRLFLSGTAWRNNFERSWSVMRFLYPERFLRGDIAHDNRYLFNVDRIHMEEIWTNRYDSRTGQRVKVKKFTNEIEPGKLLSEAPGVIIHKKREECCQFHTVEAQGHAGFLPLDKPQIIEHVVDLTPKQEKAIADLENVMLTFLEENPLVVDLPITLQQRIRQICLGEPEVEDYETVDEFGETVVKQRLWFKDDCKSPFYDMIKEIVEEDEEEATVVYLESQSFAEVLVRKLNKDGIPAFEFSGKTVKTRDEDLKLLGTKYRVAVLVIAAGGTGTNGIQRRSRREIWAERSLDETNNIQAENRQDRLGGLGQVQRHYLLDRGGRAAGRMSEQIAQRIALNETLRKV